MGLIFTLLHEVKKGFGKTNRLLHFLRQRFYKRPAPLSIVFNESFNYPNTYTKNLNLSHMQMFNKANATNKANVLRKCAMAMMLLFAVFLSPSSYSQTLLSENFESATFPPAGWALVNAGLGNQWTRSTATSSPAQLSGSTAYMRYAYSSTQPANAWAFTPALSLTSGTQYVLDFYYGGSGFTENLKITIGNGQTVPDQTTTLLTLAGITNSALTRQVVAFTVPTTGSYNIAFNCYSAADQFNLAIDQVQVRTPVAGTSTATGGLWSSPATWIGGVVPDAAVIDAGAIVTVDQPVSVSDLTINGTLQWNGTSNAMTVRNNLTINSGGSFLPYTTGSVGQTVNVGGNFVNNGYANFSLASTLLNFNGSGSTLSGTGTLQGNGTDGIVRTLAFQNFGSNSISTNQNIITSTFAHTAGSLNTGGKLKIDNTAQVYGQALNQRVANIAVTTMGAGYTTNPPVVFGTAVTKWAAATGLALNTRYFAGTNVYLCTTGGTSGGTAPTTTGNTTFADGAAQLLYLGQLGTLGVPFQTSAANVVGTQYQFQGTLYTALNTATPTVAGAASLGTTPGATYSAGTAQFLCVGTAATVAVNYDATTQTVRSLSLTNAGAGYSAAPALVFSNSGTTPTTAAAATVVYIQQVAGPASSITQKTQGLSLTGGIAINSDQGTSIATANAQASSGVGAISTTNGGVNYTVVPTVGFTGPTALNLVSNGGSGYTTAPTITVDATNLVAGTNLTTTAFTITMNQGKIVSVYLTSPGTAVYSAPPTLTLSSALGGATLAWPSGCWPSATPVIGSNGQLTNFTINSPGFGYVAAPTVGFGPTSGTPLGGTFTTAATAPTARVALYNLTLSFYLPATSVSTNADDASIPTSRKINSLTLGSTGGAGLTLSDNLTIYGSTTPLSLTASSVAPFNVIDLGGKNLNFTWSAYSGVSATFGATNTYIKNGTMSLMSRGGTGTYTFPFAGTFSCIAGTTPTAVTTGSTVTKFTVTETGAPSGGGAIGTRAYRVNTNGGSLGTNPTVTMNWNSVDALTGNLQNLYISQAPALSGPWTARSAATGSGAVTATGTRTTATTGVGPIVPTGNDFYAWTSIIIDTTNVTVPIPACPAASHLINADITSNAGTITSVTLNYSYNAVAQTPISMTNSGGNTWTATIPVATPSNATVTWTMTAVSSSGVTRVITGASYIDEPLASATASITTTPSTVCAGVPSSLTAAITVGGNPYTLGGANYTWSNGVTTVGTGNPLSVSPSVTTTYTVTISNAGGCSITSSPATLTVNPLPGTPGTTNSVQCGTGTPAAFVTSGGGGGAFKWYLTPSGGSPIAGQSGPLLSSYPISAPTHFYVSELDLTTGCESLRADLFADVTAPDAVLAAVDNNNPCANSPIQLSVSNVAPSPNNTYTYGWTSTAGSGLSAVSTPGQIITVTPTVAGTYTYTVTATDGGCVTQSTVNVTVKVSPTSAVAQSSSTPCSGGTINLTSSAVSGFGTTVTLNEGFEGATFPPASWTLINAGTGNSWISSGTLTSPTPHTGTKAMAYLYNSTNAANAWAITPGQAMNAGATYTLSFWYRTGSIGGVYAEKLKVTVGALATVAGQTTVLWDNNGGANLVNEAYAQATVTFTPVTTGTYYFGFNCYSLADRNVMLIDDVTISTPSPVTYSWSSSPAGFTSSIQNPTGAIVSTPTTFTVTASNIAGCSANASVLVTPFEIPPTPSATNGTDQCGTGISDMSVSSNNTVDPQSPPFFRWYDAASAGVLKQASSSTTYTTAITATTTLYVSEVSSNGCEGPRTAVTTIVSDPDPLTVTVTNNDLELCLGESTDITSSYTPDFNSFTTFDLTATGGAASGVTGSVSLTVSGNGTLPYTITPTAPGTYIYTISAFDPDKGCTSVQSVTVTVSPLPTLVTAASSASSVCTGNTINLTSSAQSNTGASGFTNFAEGFETYPPASWTFINAGSGSSWIASNTLTTPTPHTGANALAYLYNSNFAANTWAITPGQVMTAGKTYTVSFWYNTGSIGGLYPEKLKVTVGTLATVAAQTTVLWNNNGGANLVNETYQQAVISYTPAVSGTYYFGFNCYSDADMDALFVDDVSISIPAFDPSSFAWTSAPAGFTSAVQNPTNVVVNATTTYTVTATNIKGCSASANVSVTALPLPNAPIASGSTQCGQGIPQASITTGGGGGNGTFNWYANSTGGTALQSSTSATYTTAVNATTTFYVSEMGTNGCEGPRSAVLVTVTTPPSISTAGSTTAVCLNGTVTLNVTSAESNYAYTWTATPGTGSGISGSLAGSALGTSSNTITPTAANNYTYTVTASESINGCTTSATVATAVNANPPISSVTATPATICAGGTSELKAVSLSPVSFFVGKPNDTGGFSALTDYGMYFNTVSAATINSVEIYPSTAGTLTVQLRNASSTVVDTRTFTIASGDISTTVTKTLALNFSVPAAANGWYIYYTGLNINRGSGTYVYPYTSNGFSITGNTIDGNPITNGTRYYFYNWNVTAIGDNSAAYSWEWTPGPLAGSTVNVSPTITTNYTVKATNTATGCFSVSSTPVTVTVTAVGASATASPSTPVCAGTSVTLNGGATGGGPFSYVWNDGTSDFSTQAAPVVAPTVTTTYTVTVKDVCGNPTTSSVTVTVNPLPTASIAEAGPIAICAPATQVLTAVTNTATASYQWTLNGVNITLNGTGPTYTVTGAGTGTYRVIVTNTTTNCSSAASAGVVVTINPQPGAVDITSTATGAVCDGASQVLTAVSLVPNSSTTASGTISVAIPDVNATGITNNIAVSGIPAGATIDSVIVLFNVTHTFTQDLVLSIEAPNGKIINLVNGLTASGSGFTNTRVSSDNTKPLMAAAGNPYTGTYRASATLTGFQLAPATLPNTAVFSDLFTVPNGTWRLRVHDDESIGTGTLTGWSVKIAYRLPNTNITWAPPTGLSATSGASVTANPSTTTTYTATSTNSFGCTITGTYTVNVNPRPTGVLSGSAAFCQNASNTNTNLTLALTGTGPWNYTITDGTTPVSGTTSSNPAIITVSPGSATPGVVTYTLSALSDANCTSIAADLSGSATITINPLAANPTATVTQPTCAVGTGSVTVTAPLGAGNSYTLDNLQTITWPTVTFTGVAPGAHTLTVANSFGCSSPASTSVTVDPQPFIPGGATVTGIVNVCPYIGVGATPGTPITYTASAPGATSYTWVIPPNTTIQSGGTPSNTITLVFNNGFAAQPNKQLRVTTSSVCGTGPQVIYYLEARTPVAPVAINGPINVCNFIGTSTPVSYSIAPTLSALGYSWSVSGNVTVTHPNPPGVNDTIINVVFNTGFNGGDVAVAATNECGPSGLRTLHVNFTPAATPGLISGPTNVCGNIAPAGTAATYSVAPVPTASSYTWTAPAGATISYPNGTGANGYTVTILYPAAFTSGTVSVTATNGCGTSAVPRTLSVNKLNPGTPSNIDVIQTHFCGEAGFIRTFTYTVSSMPAGAASVQWTVPTAAGAILVSGQGTTSITVTYPDAAVVGTVTAQAVNACAVSSTRSVSVKLPACPPPAFARTNATTANPKLPVASESFEVKVFPNPTVSDFKLEVLTSGKEEIVVKVIDNLGRFYKTFKVMPYQTIALGSELKPGSYLIEVRQGSVVKTTKVIKF